MTLTTSVEASVGVSVTPGMSRHMCLWYASYSPPEVRAQLLPVINGKKRMIGMLSLGDVYHKAPDHLGGEVLHTVSAHHQ
jgi:hypothetical protein